MRSSLISIMAAAFVVAAAGIATPAAATQIQEAIKLCKKNPDCKQTSSTGGSNFNVGTNEVWCPDKGECECIQCTGRPPMHRTEGLGSLRAAIVGVLSSSAAVKPSNAPTKSGGILGTGILNSGQGLPGQGPATAGAPRTPSAPPVIIR
jgi:hypothetical protein